MEKNPEISIVIPLFNENESLKELIETTQSVMDIHKYDYEVIFIDDGSTDKSWISIKEISKTYKNIFGVSFSKNYGKSQALHAGFEKAKGNFIFTLDADLQDSPHEIPLMYEILLNENLDLISGWKKKRFDSFILKNMPSKLFNWAARKVSGIKIHDFNCGLKGYRKNVVKNIYV